MKEFRILYTYTFEKQLKKLNQPLIYKISGDLVQNHEEQAQENHNQSLKRLNDRMGLGLVEPIT